MNKLDIIKIIKLYSWSYTFSTLIFNRTFKDENEVMGRIYKGNVFLMRFVYISGARGKRVSVSKYLVTMEET